jgi:hypothetical protein
MLIQHVLSCLPQGGIVEIKVTYARGLGEAKAICQQVLTPVFAGATTRKSLEPGILASGVDDGESGSCWIHNDCACNDITPSARQCVSAAR